MLCCSLFLVNSKVVKMILTRYSLESIDWSKLRRMGWGEGGRGKKRENFWVELGAERGFCDNP